MFFDQYDASPAGEHFVSCKEASLYLQSYFRDRKNQKVEQMAANVEQVGNVASETVSKLQVSTAYALLVLLVLM